MNNKLDIILDIAEEANRTLTKKDLIIPILDNFEILEQNKDLSSSFFVAKYHNNIEQFYVDGVLDENESLEDHIKKVNNSIEDNVSNNNLYQDKNYMIYFKAYQTSEFTFKIYLQDILTGTSDKLNFIRQITAYFINDQTNEFCQLSLASGPYEVNEQYKLLDNIQDLDKDIIIKNLDKSLTVIMDNIHYE